jgi:hypothetical protein
MVFEEIEGIRVKRRCKDKLGIFKFIDIFGFDIILF